MTEKAFTKYATLYDRFNQSKNYKTECANLLKLISDSSGSTSTIMEIGTGTGSFTKELAQSGSQILAFELSADMVERAKSNLSDYRNVKIECANLLEILNENSNIKPVDLICAIFHVFSYFSNEDIQTFVEISEKYLKVGGIVCFDFWDTDAVLKNPPSIVSRDAIIEDKVITRKSLPSCNQDYSVIDVRFDFQEGEKLIFSENHRMYPHSLDEALSFFKERFELCGSFNISTGKKYNHETYGNLVLLRKKQ